jgi:hypothetical protein
MGEILLEEFADWSGGVMTSPEPDAIPPNTSPRGLNSALTSAGGGRAVVSTRKGLRVMTATPITGASTVFGLFHVRPRSGETLGSILLALTDNGRLEKVAIADGTLTNLSTSFDSTSPNPPDFAVANNLCFIVNGTDKLKVTTAGTAVQNFGITRPAAAPTVASGGAGSMTGDYEVAISYFNSITGQESSRSDAASITLASEDLRVTIPNAPDTQVDYIRVHIRKTTLSTEFFRVTSGTDYQSAGGGWIDNYGNVDLDLTDAQLNDLVILSPDTEENNPPPDGIRYLCWHSSRMFAATSSTLYYSKLGFPESFDPEFFEYVNPDDGQIITGLHSVGGILVIFKSNSIWGLYGDDPNSWYLRLLDPDTGCTSHRSIVSIEGFTYWWSEEGPIQWKSSGENPFPIGKELIAPTVDITALAPLYFKNVVAAAEVANQRVLFGVAETGQTRNTLVLPWNYRLQRWEATKWDPLDVAALAMAEDASELPFVAWGGYAGRVYEFGRVDNDAVPSGTTTGTFVASGTSTSTITDAGATFYTTGNGLTEVKVTVVDSNGLPIGRARISSNTGTALTLATSITGLTNGATYTYYVGGADFQWDTPWGFLQHPFHKKRFEFLYLHLDSSASDTLAVDLAFNFNPNQGQVKSISLTGASTTWDATLWTTASYGTSGRKAFRLRVGRTGNQWRVRVRQPAPDTPVTLHRVAIQAEKQTTKVG